MAHNLNINNGKASIFTTASTWHGLEAEVNSIGTSEEVIKLAGLDYNVEKYPLFTQRVEIGKEATLMSIEDNYATVRTDTFQTLGVVGKKYTVLQNKDAFRFIDGIVGSKQAIFTSAGALGKGKKIWMSVKLPYQCVVGLDDVIDHYFVLSNTHDGSRALDLLFTQTFVVCENTLSQALSFKKRGQSIRHTSSINVQMLNSVDLMGITRAKVEELQESYKAMSKVKITDEQLRKYIELALNPASEQVDSSEFSKRFTNSVDEALEFALADDTQQLETRKGTLYGALNGVTGYINHVVEYKNPQKRLSSVLYGTGALKQQNALSLALKVMTENYQLS